MASYEVGRFKSPVLGLAKLAFVLATSVDELIGQKQVSRRGPSSKLQQQIDHVRNLPRSKQLFIIEMLDTVIQQTQQQKLG